MSVYLAELIGTMVLIIFGGGVVAGVVLKKSKAENSGWIVITFGWGFAVAFAVYAVGGISGAHLNPAVTLGLASVGEFSWSLVPGYIIAQIIGAFIGACIVFIHYLPHWRETKDQGAKLAVFSTDPAIAHTPSNLISEAIGTAVLLFGLLAIGANQFTEGLNPLIVGFLIVAIGLSLGGTTGYAINPARDLGPRIAHFFLPIAGKGSSNWKYAWVPIAGPAIGGVLGAQFYHIMFNGGSVVPLFILIALLITISAASKWMPSESKVTTHYQNNAENVS
ncbi:aquaporin family protein [Alkalihalophilus marmarensis]|jgi:glycerol uptake facilitator protein|uniref:Glycerol transporter n=1 Tax=Alkalihalophilus marmarensis DSM 21297 TaxID=1188261 RepID=U6SID2_9BACI|nr:MIP/aquaporin family protein [Alkalihalophilus marmarensis]ERN51474.1 glycerol transporter [Alkalihalophilus marmarensis DSM 21297]MCM3490313.1 aquaporin family protein [Alkalihalophilus marmarensis]